MKRVLAAVDDGSEISKLVVARAVELARPHGAKVRLVHAVRVEVPPFPPLGGVGGTPATLTRQRVREAQATMCEMLEELVPDELQDGVVVELGLPADVVCGSAATYDADLVVIGAHDYSLATRILGSTASRIVNRIDRPVFVVRPLPREIPKPESAPEITQDTTPRMEVASGSLRSDHDRLEGLYRALLATYETGDWSEVAAQWDVFEPALRAHMEAEEADVFPLFRGVDPVEARALLAEHDELRQLVATLGVGIDLRVVPLGTANRLVERLRAHGAREERLLYPWLDRGGEARRAERAERARGAEDRTATKKSA